MSRSKTKKSRQKSSGDNFEENDTQDSEDAATFDTLPELSIVELKSALEDVKPVEKIRSKEDISKDKDTSTNSSGMTSAETVQRVDSKEELQKGFIEDVQKRVKSSEDGNVAADVFDAKTAVQNRTKKSKKKKAVRTNASNSSLLSTAASSVSNRKSNKTRTKRSSTTKLLQIPKSASASVSTIGTLKGRSIKSREATESGSIHSDTSDVKEGDSGSVQSDVAEVDSQPTPMNVVPLPTPPRSRDKTFRTAFCNDPKFVSAVEDFTFYEKVNAPIRPVRVPNTNRWIKKQPVQLNRKKPLGVSSVKEGGTRLQKPRPKTKLCTEATISVEMKMEDLDPKPKKSSKKGAVPQKPPSNRTRSDTSISTTLTSTTSVASNSNGATSPDSDFTKSPLTSSSNTNLKRY